MKLSYLQVLKKAGSETLKGLRHYTRTAVFASLAFGLGTFAHFKRQGADAMWDEIGVWISYGLIGAGGTGVLYFLWNLACAPYRLEKERADTLQKHKSKSAAPSNKKSRPFPDMTIRELFLHINPEVLDDEESTLPWLKVGQEIRDAHALGKIKIWGRTTDNAWEENLLPANANQLPPLVSIGSDYFKNGQFGMRDFTYLFMDEDHQFALHASPKDMNFLITFPSHKYTDMQVNRAQILAIWPAKK